MNCFITSKQPLHHSDVFLLSLNFNHISVLCFIPIRLCIQERFVSFLFLFSFFTIEWLISSDNSTETRQSMCY